LASLPKKKKRLKSPKRPKPEMDWLFPVPDPTDLQPLIPYLRYPVWTESKANLIERYLYLFVLVAKHGVYIDAFAGPQQPERPEMWAAKLVMESKPPHDVLESKPPRLRSFYLIEKDPKKIRLLRDLKKAQPADAARKIEVIPGDCNIEIPRLLATGAIKQTEATFCLLDQHTFECKWETVRQLAAYKASGYKIELFYFLCNSWLARALSALQDRQRAVDWWGRDDVDVLQGLSEEARAQLLAQRFKDELGYKYASPYPIYERRDQGAVMFYMIHATDHPSAPPLMGRAYNQAVYPRDPAEQLIMKFDVQ